MRSSVYVLTGILFVSTGLAAEAKPAAWTVDDVILSESVSDFQVSPDGRWAVWEHHVPNQDQDEEVVNLVRLDLSSGRETVLTRGTENCLRPRWSPDGKHLAFLSSRSAPKNKAKGKGEAAADEAKNQVWLMDPFGGEPWPLTDRPRGVQHFAWAGSAAVVFAAPEEPTLRASTLKEEKDDSTVVEDDKHEPPVRLFRVETASKKVTRLTDNRDQIDSLAVSPDGRHAVTIHKRSLRFTYDNKIKPAVYLYDLAGGQRRRVFAEAHWNIQKVQWAPDGQGLYATNWHNSQPQFAQAGVTQFHYHDLARNKTVKVDLQWDNGLAQQEENEEAPGFVATRDGFLALLADGARNRVAHYRRAGDAWKREFLTGDHVPKVFGFQVSADGQTLLYAHSTASSPTQWYRARLDGTRIDKPQPIAVINEHLRELPRARTEVVRWKGARDEEVEGVLYYPHGYRRGTKYPLVVMIHGGPASADFDSWDEGWMYPANLVCQRGAFVLKPNYHGSSNCGLQWLESITRGKYGDLETIDIEKGVDALIGRGLVDAERLALCGWSNGAILANRLTAQTTRYKAAVAGAGNVEYVSDWATCEFGDAFDRYYFGAAPLENPRLYLRKSPFFRLDRVRTPTLIFSGTEDRTVSTSQAWVQYRGLQQLGKTDVRFVLSPGEKHVFKKLAHQRRKVKEELAWLDRYLFQKPGKTNTALKADSPLAWALKRQQARRDAGRYGVLVKGLLIPETVTHKGLHMGRFEVTQAQFAQFDRTSAVAPGRENHPAAGVTFEQAQSYCAWLSKATGQKYRLPTAEEAEELYGETEGNENTLDHWAGYTVNPDDAAQLRERLKELDGKAALLKEVGRFRAAGEAGVFDLGGNVAEWVRTKDGKGLLRGGSADAPADRQQKTNQAGPEYRGLRVVRE